MGTPVEGGGTLLDSGFNSGTSGNNIGSPFTLTKSGATGTFTYDSTNLGYAPSSGLLSAMGAKLFGGSSVTNYAYVEETTTASAIAELRFWFYASTSVVDNAYYACKNAKTFYLKWAGSGTLQVYIGASTGSSPYNTTGYHNIGSWATGLKQYRITFNYSAKTYTVSRRGRFGEAWEQLGESSSYNIPFRDNTATAFSGSQILAGNSAGGSTYNQVIYLDEIQYGTITDNDAQLRTVNLRQAVQRAATR